MKKIAQRMITRKKISEAISSFNIPEEEMMPQLEQAAIQFPYCQTIWMLLAFGWAVYDPLKLQQTLPKIATIVSNRIQLKHIVNSSANHIPFTTNSAQNNNIETQTTENASADTSKEVPNIQNCLQLLMDELNEIDESISEIIGNEIHSQNDRVQIAPIYDITKTYTDLDSNNSTQTDEKKQANIQIIDQFLEKQPTISRSTGDFFNPENLLEQSLKDLQCPVSETLAIILAQQGHKEKAIEIYNKLILENPEKSSYFALQITKLVNT